MKISMIACASPEFGIGANNDLLGHVPEDMKFFVSKTQNMPLFMGENTARSLPNSMPLRGRRNYVLSKKESVEYFESRGFIPVCSTSPTECLSQVKEDEIMIIGGGFIYKTFIHLASEIYLNIYYDYKVKPDIFFPSISSEDWKLVSITENDIGNLEYKKYVRK